MLRMVYGNPGNGKGIFLLWAMFNALKAGMPVASNVMLTTKCPFAHRVRRLSNSEIFDYNTGRGYWDHCKPGTFYAIDEIDLWFDSSKWQKITEVSERAAWYHKLHGHRGDEIVVTMQHVENTWVRLRRIAGSHVLCEFNRATRPFMRYLPSRLWAFIFAEHTGLKLTEGSMMKSSSIPYGMACEMFRWYRRDQQVGGDRAFG